MTVGELSPFCTVFETIMQSQWLKFWPLEYNFDNGNTAQFIFIVFDILQCGKPTTKVVRRGQSLMFTLKRLRL